MNRRRLTAVGIAAIVAAAGAITTLRILPDEKVLPLKICDRLPVTLPLGLCSHGEDPPEAVA